MSENNTVKLPEVIVFAGPNGSGKTTIPEFKDEIKSIEDYLEGKVTADYILRYWKPYEYAKEPVAQ